MSLKVDRVKTGYANLTLSERNEVRAFMEKIDKSSYTEDISLKQQIRNETKFMLGPTTDDSSKCQCCGK